MAFHEFTRRENSLEFVGMCTSAPFNRVEIREIIGTADNEFFGNFTTGTTPAPAPASLALLGAGLIAMVAARRKYRA